MKKIMFVLMAVAALSIASCDKAEKASQVSTSTSASVAPDSISADSVAVEVATVDSIKA